MKIRLQLFGGIFDPGTEPEYGNPLLMDDEPPADLASEDALEDTDLPAGEPELLEGDESEEFVEEEYQEDYPEPHPEEPQFQLDDYLTEIRQAIGELNDKLEARGREDQQVSEEDMMAAMEAENEDFWQRLQENPMQAVRDLAKQMAEEEIRPIREKLETQEKMQLSEKQVQDFVDQHGDMDQYVDEMIQILESRPYLQDQPDALEIAYKMAKADVNDMRQNVAPQKSPDELLQDENFIQRIMQDENIRKRLMASNLQEIDKGKPPVVIGSERAGGKPPMAESSKPKSLEDASRYLMESLK